VAIPEISKTISGACAPDRLKPRPPVAGTMTKALGSGRILLHGIILNQHLGGQIQTGCQTTNHLQ